MNDGGYAARNGARDAPVHRVSSEGTNFGEDFPMLCETCLGPNPYVRMVKLPFGEKLCKIANTPYQAFQWKAGPTGRYKQTIISFAVASERNICQVCLNDMKYGLPVGVRDSLLAQEEQRLALPQSDVGQRYFYENQAQLVEHSGEETFGQEIQNLPASRQLDKFSRALRVVEAKSKTAFRNLPKLCSFWLNNSCNRVLKKSCPFRPCCGAFAFPEIAGSDRELCKQLVDELTEKGPAVVMKSLDPEIRAAISKALRGNRDEAIRKRVSGDDDLTHRYLGKMKSMNYELASPEDKSICTLWLGNVEPDITEIDIRDNIYAYGHIVSIHVARAGRCAFVEFANREMAEHAASQLYNALLIKGRVISVNWAKPRAQALVEGADSLSGSGEASFMPAPPGMETMPVSAYALKGVAPPLLPPGFIPPPPPGPPKSMARKRDDSDTGGDSGGEAGFGVFGGGQVVGGQQGNYLSAADLLGAGGQAKRQAVAGVGAGQGGRDFDGDAPRVPRVVYPSMNPTRLGASGHPAGVGGRGGMA